MSKSYKETALSLIDTQTALADRCFRGEQELIAGQLLPLLSLCFEKNPNDEKELISKNVNFIYTYGNTIQIITIPLIAFLGSDLITTDTFCVDTNYSLNTNEKTSSDTSSRTESKFGVDANIKFSGGWGFLSARFESETNIKYSSDYVAESRAKTSSDLKNKIVISTKMEFERVNDPFISEIVESLINPKKK